MSEIKRIFHRSVPIDYVSEVEALSHILRLMDKRFTGQVVTLTIQMYIAARRDTSFLNTLNNASLVLPESTGLKLYSEVIPPRFGKIPGGVYLAKKAVSLCAETGKRVAIFGSNPTNRNLARDNLRREFKYPNIHTIDGEYSFASPTDSLLVADQVDLLSPDLTIMAGNEVYADQWIYDWILKKGAHAGVVGNYGQTIDYWAGTRWVPSEDLHRLGLSWALMLTRRTPERRKIYIKALMTLARLGIEDILAQATHKERENYS